MWEERETLIFRGGWGGEANHASIAAELYPQCKVMRNNTLLGVYEPPALEAIVQQ